MSVLFGRCPILNIVRKLSKSPLIAITMGRLKIAFPW